MWRIPKYMWPNSYLSLMVWILMKRSGLELSGETMVFAELPNLEYEQYSHLKIHSLLSV